MAAKPRFDGEWVRLGELISKAPIERCGGREYPVYSMTMRDGIVEQAGRFKKAIASKDTSSYKVVKKDQLVVGFPIDEGVIYVQNHDVPGIMSPAYNVWDFDCNLVNPAYLELALHGPRSMAYYADKMRGTTARRRTLTADGLCNLEIPLPSIDEQIRVVHVLDGVRSLIKGANRQIAELDALVKSRFVEMFGENSKWEHAPLGEHVDILVGFPFKSSGYVDEGVNICGGLIIGQGKIDWGACKHWPSIAGYEKYLLSSDDIVIALDRPWVKDGFKIAQVDESHLPALLIQRTARIKAIDFNQSFVRHLLEQPEFKEHCTVKGTMVPHISNKDIASYEVPVVPKQLQQEFASFVAEVDKSRFIVQKQIEKLQTLYDSLAQEYFS